MVQLSGSAWLKGRELPVEALLLVRPLVAGQVKCYANHWVRFVEEGGIGTMGVG